MNGARTFKLVTTVDGVKKLATVEVAVDESKYIWLAYKALGNQTGRAKAGPVKARVLKLEDTP